MRVYDAMVSGGLLSAATVEAACIPHSSGEDLVLRWETCFGLGFMLPTSASLIRGRAFGHNGAGGSVAFADREHGLSLAYVMSAMDQGHATDPRAEALVDATYKSLR